MNALTAVERLPRAELESLQLARLRHVVRHAALRVPLFGERLARAGVSADTIHSLDDLRRLPFTTKADFRDAYPYGLLAVPLTEVVRIHASSGTTGKPTVVAYTRRDIEMWTDVMARTLLAGAVGPGDIVQNAYGYGLFTGGLGFHYGIERVGAAAIPSPAASPTGSSPRSPIWARPSCARRPRMRCTWPRPWRRPGCRPAICRSASGSSGRSHGRKAYGRPWSVAWGWPR
jgi:phenylacetate-coenzyme A ligase PaaK-like adenylate-forming protein